MPQDQYKQREQSYQYQVKKYVGRNITVLVMNGMLGQTGVRLVQAPTYMPAYLYALSVSDFVVGLARSLEALGKIISPVIGHRGHLLGAALTLGTLMRLQILGMA